MLPRQDLDFVPCDSSGWVVQRKRVTHEVAMPFHENINKQVFIPLASIRGRPMLSAEVG
jgi:hypothetical protein